MINYGFILDELDERDFVFGSALPFEELQPDGDWTEFLPQREYQNLHGVEPYACVAFTILNCVEILIYRKYGIKRNYSDRFLAAISGTKTGGNSPRVVAKALQKKGVPLQDVWPFNQDINTFEKYYETLPQEVKDIAKEFFNEWDFRYEKVPFSLISKALKCSPLLFSVYAWIRNGKGLYYKPEGARDIHATTHFKEEDGVYRRMFDSYADGEGDPAVKDYDWNSKPEAVMRFWIGKRTSKGHSNWFSDLWHRVFRS